MHTIFNYVLQLLYTGCQWKALPIRMNAKGRPEIHYARIYRALRRWQAKAASIGFSPAQCAGPIGTDGLTSRSFTATAPPLRQRKAATTWDTADTSTSKATRSWPSAIATATLSRHSLPRRGTGTNRPCCATPCPNSVRWRAPSAWTYEAQR
ncbi:hypothetical protein BN2475_1520001 [Paraburkholderia ribeironis]|uniref:Transposase n=1 Tax=Paraburkholderia ribeironis TaxID=1247936 RepID=A0A1N7SQ81_9BURK|nr:hypothetical protein BN2475_1520001 [Paraburkholderia ribeironis]